MASTTECLLYCNACGARLQPGEALRVRPVAGGVPFAVHRVALSATCIRAAEHAGVNRIEIFDREAADEWDLAAGGQAGHNRSEAPKEWQPRPRTEWGRDA